MSQLTLSVFTASASKYETHMVRHVQLSRYAYMFRDATTVNLDHVILVVTYMLLRDLFMPHKQDTI